MNTVDDRLKIVGIDLAGKAENETGMCVLEVCENNKFVRTTVLYDDKEIMDYVTCENPCLVAIDAPLVFTGKNRACDEKLRVYGALPVTLRGMEVLAVRGLELKKKFDEKSIKSIEVFATASAKILGFYDKNPLKQQKALLTAGIKGDTEKKMLSPDEISAVYAAITGYLYSVGETETVGNEDGTIVIPRV